MGSSVKDRTIGEFLCTKPKCKAVPGFGTQQALNMHMMRVHTLAGRQGPMWKKINPKPRTGDQKLAQARQYNAAWRKRQKEKGLNSAGKPYKNPSIIPINSNQKNKRVQIVYPDPNAPEQETAEQKPMNHCPGCGLDLTQYK